jgi:hypothetical protein
VYWTTGRIAEVLRGRIGKDRRAPQAAAGTSSSAGFDGAEIDDQIAALRRAVEEDLDALRRDGAGREEEGATSSAVPVAVNGRGAATRPSREPILDRNDVAFVLRTLAAWTAGVAIGAIIGILVVYVVR